MAGHYGSVVIAVVEERAVIRRIYRSGDTITLKADNPDYPPIIVRRDEVCIAGLATEFCFKFV